MENSFKDKHKRQIEIAKGFLNELNDLELLKLNEEDLKTKVETLLKINVELEFKVKDLYKQITTIGFSKKQQSDESESELRLKLISLEDKFNRQKLALDEALNESSILQEELKEVTLKNLEEKRKYENLEKQYNEHLALYEKENAKCQKINEMFNKFLEDKNLYEKKFDSLTNGMTTLNEDHKKLVIGHTCKDERIKQLIDKISRMTDQINKKSAEYCKLVVQSSMERSREVELRDQMASMETKMSELKKDFDFEKFTHRKTAALFDNANKTCGLQESLLSNWREKCKELEKNIDAADMEITSLKKQLTEEKIFNNDLSNAKEEMFQKLELANKKCDALDVEILKLKEKESLHDRSIAKELEAKIIKLEASRMQDLDDNKELIKTLDTIKETNNKISEKYELKEIEVRNLKLKNLDLSDELTILRLFTDTKIFCRYTNGFTEFDENDGNNPVLSDSMEDNSRLPASFADQLFDVSDQLKLDDINLNDETKTSNVVAEKSYLKTDVNYSFASIQNCEDSFLNNYRDILIPETQIEDNTNENIIEGGLDIGCPNYNFNYTQTNLTGQQNLLQNPVNESTSKKQNRINTDRNSFESEYPQKCHINSHSTSVSKNSFPQNSESADTNSILIYAKSTSLMPDNQLSYENKYIINNDSNRYKLSQKSEYVDKCTNNNICDSVTTSIYVNSSAQMLGNELCYEINKTNVIPNVDKFNDESNLVEIGYTSIFVKSPSQIDGNKLGDENQNKGNVYQNRIVIGIENDEKDPDACSTTVGENSFPLIQIINSCSAVQNKYSKAMICLSDIDASKIPVEQMEHKSTNVEMHTNSEEQKVSKAQPTSMFFGINRLINLYSKTISSIATSNVKASMNTNASKEPIVTLNNMVSSQIRNSELVDNILLRNPELELCRKSSKDLLIGNNRANSINKIDSLNESKFDQCINKSSQNIMINVNSIPISCNEDSNMPNTLLISSKIFTDSCSVNLMQSQDNTTTILNENKVSQKYIGGMGTYYETDKRCDTKEDDSMSEATSQLKSRNFPSPPELKSVQLNTSKRVNNDKLDFDEEKENLAQRVDEFYMNSGNKKSKMDY